MQDSPSPKKLRLTNARDAASEIAVYKQQVRLLVQELETERSKSTNAGKALGLHTASKHISDLKQRAKAGRYSVCYVEYKCCFLTPVCMEG